jgi:hypothetical protein
VFNRPEPTRRVLEAVRQARPGQLLVVADGPRANRPGESELCAQTRALFEGLDWDCEVLTHYAEANMGCKRRVGSGLQWVFATVPEAVILEDDCLPEPGFFRFCDEMLERYREDPRVHMVRGTNVLRGARVSGDSYYFSRFYNIWGWASWARAAQDYDYEMRRWPELREAGFLERYLPKPEMVALVRHFFDETYAGRIDTWDYQWSLNGWLRGAWSIVPEHNLVSNIGFGAGATHEHNERAMLSRLPTAPLEFPLRHPPQVAVLEGTDELEWNNVYIPRQRSLLQRARSRLKHLVSGG